jgi:uncharacterized protein YggE
MKKQFPLNGKWAAIVGVIMVIALVFVSAVSGTVGAQDSVPSRVITVSGSGDAYGSPDVAYVNLGVDVSDADIGKALDSANSTMAAITAAISDVGVDAKDIQTVNYSVYPEDKYDPQTGQSTGERVYHVQTAVNVTVRDITKIGVVMQAGLNAGANTVNGLSFGIADMSSLEHDARIKAVDDARNRAQQLADAFGVKLGDVISVSESFGSVPVQTFARANALAVAASAPQISTGQLSVNVQVSVTFAIGS